MANEKVEKAGPDKSNEDAAIKSDPGTTNTTDPQEHMKGPLSSLMQKTEEVFEKNDKKDAVEDNNDNKK